MGKIDVKSTVVIDKEKIQRSLTSMNYIFKKSPPNQEAAIYIKSEDDSKLQMIANHSGVFIRALSTAESIQGLNQWCLDGAMLSKFIRTMNKGKVTIQSDDENIYAKQGRTSLKIPLMVTNSDIRSYSYNEMERLNIDIVELGKGLKQVVHACSTLGASYNVGMTGVLIDYYEDGRFNVVATDSKRLGFYSNRFQEPTEAKLKYRGIIPKTVAEEIIKVFEKNIYCGLYLEPGVASDIDRGEESKDCEFVYTFGFISDDTEFYTQTISADFPEYQKIIKYLEAPKRYIIDRELLLERMNQVSTCSDKTILTFKKDGIELRSLEGRNSSEIVVYIDMVLDIEEPLKIGVTNKYLMECIQAMHSRRVQIVIDTPSTPMGIIDYYEDNPASIKYGEVMMPYNLNNNSKEDKDEDPSSDDE